MNCLVEISKKYKHRDCIDPCTDVKEALEKYPFDKVMYDLIEVMSGSLDTYIEDPSLACFVITEYQNKKA